ncbi:MAG: hypothetical protein HC799_13000 [Limnothrix sp. RL_2_0]|nr:hypothetical protein [Limnothrix sp. RL_2_0]
MTSCHLSISIVLTSLSFLTACRTIDPTLYECQQLLEEINEVVIDAKTLTQGEQDHSPPNLEIWLQAADILKNGSEAIATLSITDEELQTHQTQISKIYSEQSQATYAMVEAWQKKISKPH